MKVYVYIIYKYIKREAIRKTKKKYTQMPILARVMLR